ncbi:MAG: hypothetical protein SWQ30_09315 [Thermodesulfobacteriota bacterium]|nr:hypothetical protein [Thermodesulfobacteriota bacterium]
MRGIRIDMVPFDTPQLAAGRCIGAHPRGLSVDAGSFSARLKAGSHFPLGHKGLENEEDLSLFEIEGHEAS